MGDSSPSSFLAFCFCSSSLFFPFNVRAPSTFSSFQRRRRSLVDALDWGLFPAMRGTWWGLRLGRRRLGLAGIALQSWGYVPNFFPLALAATWLVFWAVIVLFECLDPEMIGLHLVSGGLPVVLLRQGGALLSSFGNNFPFSFFSLLFFPRAPLSFLFFLLFIKVEGSFLRLEASNHTFYFFIFNFSSVKLK